MNHRYCTCIVFAAATLIAAAQDNNNQNQPSTSGTLPPGLEKRDQLPPGLQGRDQLPPGLAKRTNNVDNANTNSAVGGTDTNAEATTGFGGQTNNVQTNATGGTGTNFRSSTGFGTNATRFNRFGTNQPQSSVPGAGGTAAGATTTTGAGGTATANANAKINITVASQAEQPIATEIRRVIVAEPALVDAFPGVTIQVQPGGVVNLGGTATCAAQGALISTLIRQHVPRARVVNGIRVR